MENSNIKPTIDAEFVRFEHSNPDYERWVTVVKVQNQEHFVYVDADSLTVSPCGCAKRATFQWDDWAFENCQGDVVRASILAVLCVAIEDISAPRKGVDFD
jgi:hypothetical protein